MHVQVGLWLDAEVLGQRTGRHQREVVVVGRNDLGALALDAHGEVVTRAGP